MKIEIEIDFLAVGKEKVTKKLLKREKDLPDVTLRTLCRVSEDIEKNYFARRKIIISQPECLLNTKKGLKGLILFNLEKVLGFEVTPERKTSIIMKAFEKDLEDLGKILKDYFKSKKIEVVVRARIK